MLDARKLATLRAVVEHGSLSAAARACSLTQPAVSRQVAVLEAQLGTLLVERTRRGVRPTPAGRLLAEHAAGIERRLERAEEEVGRLAGHRRMRVRLGSFFTAFAQLTPELEAAAERRLPAVELVHELIDRTGAYAALAAGRLDAAVVFEHEPAPPPAGIALEPLFTDPARVLLPARHPLARRRALHVADLDGATWVRPHAGAAGDVLDRMLAATGAGHELLLSGRGDEPVEGQVYVAAGAGVMLAWELNVIVNREGIAVRPLLDGPPRTVSAALPAADPDPAARAVADLLRTLRA
jgi:DNA-binding transcriptional LysR family regulator